ncbi:MAG: metalloregulator ArsR/SmtB family transcription factor [Bdellovibrionales bacterium]|nr:metalloregulator ArsR/SmtB family transcription factor [Bdellovibrionales bacterium]
MVDNKEEHLDRVFSALGDHNRRKMLRMLAKQSLNVSELGEPFGITKQAVSKHLRVLEGAGLVKKQKDGRVQRCSFNPKALDQVQKVVDQYRGFWDRQLDSLDEYIQSVTKQGEKK